MRQPLEKQKPVLDSTVPCVAQEPNLYGHMLPRCLPAGQWLQRPCRLLHMLCHYVPMMTAAFLTVPDDLLTSSSSCALSVVGQRQNNDWL